MQSVQGITKLQTVATFTMILIFGVIAGIFALALWLSGISGSAGVMMALILSAVLIGVQWWIGPTLIRWLTRMKEIGPAEHPELHKMVEELAKKAEIPTPKLYLVYDGTPNAFAFGRTQKDAGIALNTGLLNILNKDEVRAVVAHEVGHIKHNDVIVMTVASVLPVFLYYLVIILGNKNDREKSVMQTLFVFAGAIIAQLFGKLLVSWLSRTREYYADAFSAYATENPNALMSGLVKIGYGLNVAAAQGYKINDSMKAFYVGEPSTENLTDIARAIDSGDATMLESALETDRSKSIMEWLSTHPLTVNRLISLNKIRKELV